MTFEKKLNKLFAEAIGVNDTIWHTNCETLQDAIMRIYIEEMRRIYERKR